jgi:hypothetical protein
MTPPDPPSRIGPALVAFAVLLVGLLNLALLGPPGGGVLAGQLADPDAYLRLLRILALREGAGWFDDHLDRVAAPEGLVIQWTRPTDLLILLPALALEAVGGLPPARALLLAGMAVSPVLHLAAALAAAWAAQAIWPGRAPWYAVLLAGASPAAMLYSNLGRADHHALILFAITLALGFMLRALRPGAGAGHALAAGAAFGFGVWVGPEVLLVAVPALAAIGLAALLAEDGRAAARQGARIALGMAAMAALAILAEHAPGEWLRVAYDQVSVHHLVLALLLAAVFAVAAGLGSAPRGRRATGAAAAAGAALALLLALFPDALRGPLGSADEAYLRILHPTIMENRALPPFGPGSLAGVLLLLGGAVPAALLALALAWRGWVAEGRWPAGLALAAAVAGGLVATLAARRFALDLAAPAAIAGAGLVGLVLRAAWPRTAALRAVLAAAALFGSLGLPLVGAARPEPGAAPGAGAPACDWTAMARWLDAARPGIDVARPAPILLAADLFAGSEIAWRTPYRSVAVPHHRAGAAIADTATVMAAATPEAARDVLSRRGAALLLTCGGPPAGWAGTPGWLEPVPLPGTLGAFRLFLVAPGP